MNLLAIAGTSFVVALSGALMPGPLLAATIDHSLRRGARAGPLLICGHAVLEFLLIVLIVAGFGDLLKREIVFRGISILGGLLLIAMGTNMARARPAAWNTTARPSGLLHSTLVSGILFSVSNPYWSIWWATIGLTYIAIALPYGWGGITVFFLGHVSGDLLWYSAVSTAVSRGRSRLPEHAYRALMVTCGVFLVGFGGWLLARSLLRWHM